MLVAGVEGVDLQIVDAEEGVEGARGAGDDDMTSRKSN